ncbi:NAD(P)-dependent oxidoreductase [Mesorhizobium sp. RP14(2022)]|uniref:NAD(P)-dependent oxidoreductase n=1 Tax=Mesorhizobium liriopis TaxID=2953882 RepID=A0ABT1C4A0_9HYPH|nr:NAD(P)-dependent oxidoreductase [Mesorhizobium liriopis]MCO6049343.1 NAD(P)-dependent oxidoreductase [Mesorhizobium liriopis]
MTDALKSSRVVVTGAGGAIGGRLVRSLLEAGAHVTAVDLHLAHMAADPTKLRCVEADIADAGAVRAAVDGADIVYHLAYLMGEEANREPVAAARINAVGGTGLLQACSEVGIGRVILASSVTVFGSRSDYKADDLPLGDDAALLGAKGVAVYGAGKVYMELLAGFYAREHGITITGLRPGAVVGASRKNGRAKALANVVATAASGQIVSIPNGRAAFQAIHIDDVVGAFVALASVETNVLAGGRFFNLAGDYATMRSFCDEVAAQLPGSRFEIEDGNADELFGSVPQVLDEGVSKVVGYARHHRSLREAISAEIEEIGGSGNLSAA